MPEIEQLNGDAQPETAAGASGSELSPPQNALFGKYELGKLLGCGAFGKVYHARNIRSGQSVAIKTISKRKVVKGGLVPHIKREISIMRRMRHPRIVKLYEVLATKTKIYFVLEFIKGGELFSKIAKGRLDEDLSRRYFQQLISAIGYCHSHGVFHRDLKPENLLLDENGDLKVSDFGLSAIAEQIRDDGLLHTLCGTPAYVAPEILAKKGYDGSKVDIWSCGIILYVLNAGYLPFNDPNLMKIYKKIYRGEYRSPRWFSVELRRLLSRLLDTNPETRITVHEITRDNWFRKGGIKELKFHEDDDEFFAPKPDKNEQSNQFLNAFDIISFSSGFDLSGLFNESDNPVDGRKFLSAQAPDKIMEKLQEVGKREGMSVRKKNESLIGMQKAYLLIKVEVYRLTETLVVVDVKKKGGDIESSEGVWSTKILPELSNLVYRQESRVAGDIASTS